MARQLYPQSEKIVNQLEKVFATAKHVEMNLRSYAWNVVDPRFTELHLFYCEAAKALKKECDRIGKRLRAFDQLVPTLPSEILKLSSIQDNVGVIGGNEQFQNLLRDGTTLCRLVLESIKVAEKAGDATTSHVLTDFDEELSKINWKVRSHLAVAPQGKAGSVPLGMASGGIPASMQPQVGTQKTTTA